MEKKKLWLSTYTSLFFWSWSTWFQQREMFMRHRYCSFQAMCKKESFLTWLNGRWILQLSRTWEAFPKEHRLLQHWIGANYVYTVYLCPWFKKEHNTYICLKYDCDRYSSVVCTMCFSTSYRYQVSPSSPSCYALFISSRWFNLYWIDLNGIFYWSTTTSSDY